MAAGLRCVLGVREKNVRAIEEGKPLVWTHLLMTPEIFRAMDIETFNADVYSPQMAGLRKEGPAEFIDIAENAGVPTDMCSIPKGVIGAILAGQMPAPSLYVTQSHPCDAMVTSIQVVENLLKVPIFCLDAPIWNDDRAIDYYARQLKEMVAFLEERTGHRLDHDRLREIVEESNRAMELRLAVNELKRAVPCPLSSLLSWLAFQVYFSAAGSPEATDFFRQLLHHIEEQVKAGKGVVPEEKARVVWGGPPLFFGDIGGWMERQWGTVTVAILWGYEGYHYIDTTSYDSMIKGIAQKLLDQIMAREFRGPFEHYLDDFLRLYEEYKGDCLIFPGSITCKSLQATIGILKDVCRERGIPMLVIEVDLFDERVTPEEAIKAQIEQFLTTTVLQ
jgi:benzoyl-CoA reductase/2-hydroxyglutaryl-CoA dehydratase subunit BcrC/BadD/HgdB